MYLSPFVDATHDIYVLFSVNTRPIAANFARIAQTKIDVCRDQWWYVVVVVWIICDVQCSHRIHFLHCDFLLYGVLNSTLCFLLRHFSISFNAILRFWFVHIWIAFVSQLLHFNLVQTAYKLHLFRNLKLEQPLILCVDKIPNAFPLRTRIIIKKIITHFILNAASLFLALDTLGLMSWYISNWKIRSNAKLKI